MAKSFHKLSDWTLEKAEEWDKLVSESMDELHMWEMKAKEPATLKHRICPRFIYCDKKGCPHHKPSITWNRYILCFSSPQDGTLFWKRAVRGIKPAYVKDIAPIDERFIELIEVEIEDEEEKTQNT